MPNDVTNTDNIPIEDFSEEEEISTEENQSEQSNLLISRIKKKKINIFETFTKFWVSLLMINAVVDMNLSYILAFLGREQIAETLSIAVVTEIIGVMAVYLVRAFLDSHFEAKDVIEHKKLDVYSLLNNVQPSTASSNDSDMPDELGEDDEFDEEIDGENNDSYDVEANDAEG